MAAKRVKKAAILVCAGFIALSLSGVDNTALGAPSNREARIREETWGRVFLSTSPKMSLSCDGEGEVLEARGLNQDERKLLERAGDSAGADCDTAVCRLVRCMDDKGWSHGGKNERELLIESEKGSVYPRADFMKEVGEAAWEAVSKNGIDITITPKDNGKQSEQLCIGKSEAKRIAIRELGLKENEPTYKGCDLNDGVYELRLLINGRRPKVDVSAAIGRIADVGWDSDTGAWDDSRLDDDDRFGNNGRFDGDDHFDDDGDRSDDDDHDDDDGDRHDDDHNGNDYDD